jgi:hypothetical protein
MTQTLYAHMNKRKNKENKVMVKFGKHVFGKKYLIYYPSEHF